MELKGDIRWDGESKARLTVLSFSAGRQSTALLRMVLDGTIEKPENFIVLNADPGMENSKTYEVVAEMKALCKDAGIYFETVDGPNLYEDLVQLPTTSKTRADTPAYFVKKPNGKRGRLRQECTAVYKIAPMDRAMRRYMNKHLGISLVTKRIPQGFVEKWIGFTADEAHRIKPPPQRYVTFHYPLVVRGMTKVDTEWWMSERGYDVPPTSVCNACFANSPAYLREMYAERPSDWAQAVAVDKAVRDWTQIGVKNPVYVSDTLRPLAELATSEFKDTSAADEESRDSCDSGYCFV